MKPFDDDDRDEAAVIEFFKSRKRGWMVERVAPSIPRVSCYVLTRGTVHVTEYKGCSFSVLIQADAIHTGWAPVLATLQTLDDVGEKEKFEARMQRLQDDLDEARHYGESVREIANAGGPVGGMDLDPPPWSR